MKANEFLLNIARQYCPRIEAVVIDQIDGAAYGLVWKNQETNYYVIVINESRLICPYQTLFVLYHEIGHVKHNHLEDSIYLRSPVPKDRKEREASMWAFREMGMVDDFGWPKQANKECCECIRMLSTQCLKEEIEK